MDGVQIVGVPRLMKKAVAELYVGGKANLRQLEELKLLEPVKRTARSCYYDVRDVDAAIDGARAINWGDEGEAS